MQDAAAAASVGIAWSPLGTMAVVTSAANRLIGEVVQSQRRP